MFFLNLYILVEVVFFAIILDNRYYLLFKETYIKEYKIYLLIRWGNR
jgi:hypothetical protein